MQWLAELSELALSHGVAAFVVLYFFFVMLPLPRWPLTVAAGAAFGLWKGLALALVLGFSGSVGSFLISRYLMRRSLEKIIERRPRFKAVNDAMRDGGWKAVALLQMSPAVPFGLQNYFMGASKVRLSSYLRGTVITGLPSTFLYVSAGAGGRMVGSLEGGVKWVAIAAGLAVTIAFTVWINRLAKKRLAAA
ncbi:MAG TPA: VTT domain-containing protein [Usitatibacter sp.]|nr:VTT domain-containing protein [Usitatibacter sp.]